MKLTITPLRTASLELFCTEHNLDLEVKETIVRNPQDARTVWEARLCDAVQKDASTSALLPEGNLMPIDLTGRGATPLEAVCKCMKLNSNRVLVVAVEGGESREFKSPTLTLGRKLTSKLRNDYVFPDQYTTEPLKPVGGM